MLFILFFALYGYGQDVKYRAIKKQVVHLSDGAKDPWTADTSLFIYNARDSVLSVTGDVSDLYTLISKQNGEIPVNIAKYVKEVVKHVSYDLEARMHDVTIYFMSFSFKEYAVMIGIRYDTYLVSYQVKLE